jgi:hypothetical protein
MKIQLNQPAGGFNLSAINANFQKIQDEFNNKVLYRQNPGGEANQMTNNQDMNSNRILNLPVPATPNEAARLQDVQNAIGNQSVANLTGFAPYQIITANNVQGAVQQTIDFITSLNFVNVKTYGAKGDGVSDDTVAIQTAINANKWVFFPAGTYNISNLLTTPSGQIRYLVGQGVGVSIINQTGLTLGGVRFNVGYAQGGGLLNLTIKGNAPTAQAQGSTGIGLQIVNSNDNFICRDFEVTNFDKGIRIDGCYQPRFEQFRVLYFQNYGIYLSPFVGTGTDGAGSYWRIGKISNFGFTGNNTASVGLWLQQSSGEFFDTLDITTVNTGVYANPPSTSYVRYLFMSKVLGDSCLTNNWLLDGSQGTVVANEFSQCWSSNCQGVGIVFTGINIDSQRFTGGWVRDSRQDGIQIQGGTNISFTGTEITRNSAASPNVYSGVVISPNVNSFRFNGCRIGNVSTTVGVGQQLYAIVIQPGTSTGFVITDCDLNDNTGASGPISNGSSSSNFICSNNLPLQTVSVNQSDRITLSGVSAGTVAAGSTMYLGPQGASSFPERTSWVTSRKGLVTEMHVSTSVSPGPGESYTYTVLKNNVPTAMTGIISGSGTSVMDSIAHRFTVDSTDWLTIQIVTSSGAAVSDHRFYLSLEP